MITVEAIKKNNGKKILFAEFKETPIGYCYELHIKARKDGLFAGNIFQITRHCKWLNAKKGYLGAYFKNKNKKEKIYALLRIILVFGWIRKRLKKPDISNSIYVI